MGPEKGSVPAADILLVDHDAAALDTLARLLASQGHVVMQATSGREALSLTKLRAPDLVIAEVMMLGMDGIELARELRRAPHTRDVPVLLMSERQDRETRVRVGEVAEEFLAKPLDGLELMFRVHFMLKCRQRLMMLHGEVARLTAENERLVRVVSQLQEGRRSVETGEEIRSARVAPLLRRS